MRNADDSKRAMTRHCSGVIVRQWQRCSFQAQKSCGPTKNSHLHHCWERELPKPRYPTSQCDKHSCLFSQTSVRVLIESIYGEDFNFKSSNASVLWGFSLESGNWIVWSNFLSKNLLDIFIKHSILYIILQEYLLVGLSSVFVFGLESEENLCAVCICVFLQCSECNVKHVFCNVQCAVGNVHVNTYTCIHIKYTCIPYRSILKLSGVKNAKHATF